MLKLNALELLKKRGKTKYWLYKQMGMSYQNFTRMINNQTKSIKYDNLEAMCYIFECRLDELLVFTDDEFENKNYKYFSNEFKYKKRQISLPSIY